MPAAPAERDLRLQSVGEHAARCVLLCSAAAGSSRLATALRVGAEACVCAGADGPEHRGEGGQARSQARAQAAGHGDRIERCESVSSVSPLKFRMCVVHTRVRRAACCSGASVHGTVQRARGRGLVCMNWGLLFSLHVLVHVTALLDVRWLSRTACLCASAALATVRQRSARHVTYRSS